MSRSFRRLAGWRQLGALAAIAFVTGFACTKNDMKPGVGGNGGATAGSGGGSGTGGKGGTSGTSGASGSGGMSGSGGGSGSGGAGGLPSPDGGRADRPMMPKTCRDIRSCLWGCNTDMACQMYCISSAPMAAQNAYKDVQACSKAACPKQDADCRCQEECFAGGSCFDLIDADCDMGGSDDYCDEECH
jgi:hypothetical protein